MRSLIAVVLVALLGLAAVVQAATLTLTFTQAQVDAATWAYAQAPASERSAYPTIQLWFASRVSSMIADWSAQKAAAEAGSVCGKFNAFSGAAKTNTCTAFSLTSGQTFATDPSGCVAVCP